MLGKRGRFVQMRVAAQAPWGPGLLGGRTEHTTGSPLPPSLAVWLLSLSKGVWSGGLRARWRVRLFWSGPGDRLGLGVGKGGHRKGVTGRAPYQVDVIRFYVLEEDAGHMLCVPLHSRVIWEIPGRKKHNLSTVSNQVQTPP